MKKLNYFSLGMLAAAATFSACSSSDDVASGNQTGETTTAYLTININNVDGTRADGDYEVGSDTENEIKSLYLYFYDKDNKAVNVGGTNTDKNRIDAKNQISNTQASTGNIEEKFTVELQLPDGVKPARMIVVANSDKEPTPTDLDSKTIDGKYVSDNGFIMSSSTYLDETDASNKKVIYYTTLTEANFSATSGMEAKAAEAYIERVVAKVTTSFASTYRSSTEATSGSGTYNYQVFELKDNATTPANITYTAADGSTGNILKAQIKGWNVVYAGESYYLLKNLETTTLSSESSWKWNDASNFRSYWSLTPTIKPTYLKVSEYNNISNASIYSQEHTPASTDETTVPTLLVVAQILDKNGNPFTNGLCYYNGEYVETSQTKTRLANVVNNRILIKSEESSAAKVLELTSDNIKIAQKNGSTAQPDQYVAVATVTGTIPTSGTYSIDGGTNWTDVNSTEKGKTLQDAINEILGKISVLYYSKGYTYYFTKIKHLNTTTGALGEYGLVRNHVYKVDISRIAGTGTPIPTEPGTGEDTPNEPIYPENPSTLTTTYMKARINVLSWRIVNNSNVTLK